MTELMLHELKRISLKPHIIGLFIANIIILLLTMITSVLISFISEVTIAYGFAMTLDSLSISLMLVRATLIVWEAVLISSIIIEEYRSKTIVLLYTYPVNRAKLIYSKVALICLIMLAFHIVSSVFQNLFILFLSGLFENITYAADIVLSQLIIIPATILVGLLPMCIGMLKKSTIATIISSILIVAVASNSQGSNAGLLSIPFFAIILGLVGIIFTSLTIRKMVHTDLYN